MRLFVAGLFLAGVCFGQSEATLSGRVTDAATHQPIEGAQIATQGGRGARAASATSDASGAYSIRLPASERQGLAISKAGYSTLDLRSSDRTFARLNPGDSETRDFELSKPGSLSGHLVDRDSGKPLTGFYIHAIRWYEGLENNTGFRYPAAATSGDGSFSIANLPPANYVMVVDPPMAGKITAPDQELKIDPKKDEAGYGPTWYPGVPQPDMATPIMLGYAEDRRIEMRLRKHELLHIAGTFQAPEGMESGSITITVATEEKGRPTGAEGQIPRAGPFRIDGLEEGSYWILAATRSSDGQKRAFASKLIALTGHSVDDLRVEMRPGVTLRVAVKMAEDKVDPPRRFSFFPVSKEGWGPMIDDGPPNSDTRMIRTGLPPGRYDVALNQTPGYAVASMTVNGTPVPPGVAMDLESPESALTFVLTTQLGNVTGVVRDSQQKAVADARVVLAPDSLIDTGADFFSLPPGSGEMAAADGAGRFTFNGLAAGRYRVIALPGGLRMGVIAVESALIRERMRTAQVVEVTAGQSTTLDVGIGK